MCDLNCVDCVLEICEDCEDILADIDERNQEMLDEDNYLKAVTEGQKKYRKRAKHFREYNRTRQRNREKAREYDRRYYHNHIERERARARKYWHEHLEAKRAYQNAYRASHREYYNQLEYKRRIENREAYNAYMAKKNKEYRIRKRVEGLMLEVGKLIKVSKYCVDEYLKVLKDNGVTAIHREDLTEGRWTKLEITDVKYEGKKYESMQGRR